MNNAFIICIALSIGMVLGAFLRDSGTLKSCATKESAVLMGGTTIECTVRKEAKK